jgi:MFS family permease
MKVSESTGTNSAAMTKSATAAYLMIALSQFLVASDFSYTTIGLASMQKELQVDASLLQWIVSAWALTFGGAVIFGGRLADVAGYRISYMAGMLSFGVGTLLVASASALPMVIAGRALIGLGGALIKPAVLAFIGQTSSTPQQRKKVLASYYMWNGLGAGVGLVAGGLLINLFGWRSMFVASALIVVMGSIAGLRALEGTPQRNKQESLDLAGSLLATGASTLLILMLSLVSKHGWLSAPIGLAALGTLVAVIGFILVERRTPNPAVPLGIFKLPNFSGALCCAVCVSASNASMLVLLPLYLQKVAHYSAFQASLTSIPMVISVFVFGNFLIPRITKDRTSRFAMLTGFSVLIALALCLSAMTPQLVPWLPLLFASFNNFGYFMVQMSTAAEITGHVAPERRGVASGVYIAAIDFSPGLGVALASIGLQPATAGGADDFSSAFLVSASIAAVGVLITWAFIRIYADNSSLDSAKAI